MRILHVEMGRNLYGGARQVLYLMEGLARAGADGVLACPPRSPVEIAARARGLDVVNVPMRSDMDPAFALRVAGLVRRIRPGISWERFNWGLSRSPELNLHPSRNLPRLDAEVMLDEVWWRLEEQSLVALPRTGGVLFGIRLVIRPLREIKADPAARRGMIRALRTMPEPMARYKGIAPARTRLLELMEGDTKLMLD